MPFPPPPVTRQTQVTPRAVDLRLLRFPAGGFSCMSRMCNKKHDITEKAFPTLGGFLQSVCAMGKDTQSEIRSNAGCVSTEMHSSTIHGGQSTPANSKWGLAIYILSFQMLKRFEYHSFLCPILEASSLGFFLCYLLFLEP